MQQKIFNLRLNIYLTVAVALALLIFFHSIGVLKPVENVLLFFLKPIERASYQLGINIFGSEDYLNKEQLKESNKELQGKLSNILIENARLHSVINKSETLQKELQFIEENNYKAVTAQLVGKSSDTTSQVFILNKGKSDNLQVGYPVIYLDGVLVGKIFEVEDSISKMLLVNDSNSAIAATIQNTSNSPGIVVGELGLSMEMQLIPQAEEIEQGQIAVTSGLEEDIPQGLVIGQITEVQKKTEELFQTATIESPILLERLDVVSIITPQ